MATLLLQIVDGIETVVENATSLRMTSHVADDGNPPFGFVVPPTIERGAFMRGQKDLTLELIVFTSRAVDRVGQRALLEYCDFTGSKSIFKAIDDNSSLSLSGVHAVVLSYRPLGIDEIAAYGYFGGAFELQIVAST